MWYVSTALYTVALSNDVLNLINISYCVSISCALCRVMNLVHNSVRLIRSKRYQHRVWTMWQISRLRHLNLKLWAVSSTRNRQNDKRLRMPIWCWHVWQKLISRWDTRTWRDVSSYMVTYLPLNYDTPVLPNIFEVTRTYLKDVGLRKAPFVFCYYPLSVFLEWTIILSVVSRFIRKRS